MESLNNKVQYLLLLYDMSHAQYIHLLKNTDRISHLHFKKVPSIVVFCYIFTFFYVVFHVVFKFMKFYVSYFCSNLYFIGVDLFCF